MFKMRCSELHLIMSEPKTKALREADELSEGAKTFIKGKAKEYIFSYTKNISTKEMLKGQICESESIELLNKLMIDNGEFIEYSKNEIKLECDYLAGTPDIISHHIRDIKTSWSICSFPASIDDAIKLTKASGYDWQVKGYIHLAGINGIQIESRALVDYCLVNTSIELIPSYELLDIHDFDDIPINLRITSAPVDYLEFDDGELITKKCLKAQEYFDYCVEMILSDHGVSAVNDSVFQVKES